MHKSASMFGLRNTTKTTNAGSRLVRRKSVRIAEKNGAVTAEAAGPSAAVNKENMAPPPAAKSGLPPLRRFSVPIIRNNATAQTSKPVVCPNPPNPRTSTPREPLEPRETLMDVDVEMVPESEVVAAVAESCSPEAAPVFRLSEVPGCQFHWAAVPDLDAADEDVPALVADLVVDAFAYLRTVAEAAAAQISPPASGSCFITAGGGELTPIMRYILVDWMVQVHQRFTLLPETLYLAVHLLDRYLLAHSADLPKKELQLVGVTALLLASKYEEMYPPEIRDFVLITDSSYTAAEIRAMELRLLACINYRLTHPPAIAFLRRCSKIMAASDEIHTLAKYLLELHLVKTEMCHLEGSRVAAASLWLAMWLLMPGSESAESAKSVPGSAESAESGFGSVFDPASTGSGGATTWSPILVAYSGYSRPELLPVVTQLLHLLRRQVLSSRYRAIKKKYSSPRLLGVASRPCVASPHLCRVSRAVDAERSRLERAMREHLLARKAAAHTNQPTADN